MQPGERAAALSVSAMIVEIAATSAAISSADAGAQGAIGGGVFGLALGGFLASNHHPTDSDDYTAMGLLIGTPVTGVIVGTIIGSLAGTKTIYRAQTQEIH